MVALQRLGAAFLPLVKASAHLRKRDGGAWLKQGHHEA